ncbi:MAG: chemotaxis protein CheW [Thermaerobacter sp.]
MGTDAADTEVQVVVFELAGEDFALPVQHVREILTWQPVTAVPRTADHVLGITNIRGQVTPVVSLRAILGLGEAEIDRRTRIVVVELGDEVGGLVVDAVKEVLRVSSENMTQPSDVVSHAEHLKAVIQVGERLILLLDAASIVREGGLSAAAAAADTAGTVDTVDTAATA